MGLCNNVSALSLFFLSSSCVLGLVIIVGDVANAQNSSQQQDFLDAHNAARSEVNVSNLVWNDTIADYALDYANQRKVDCNQIHSDLEGGLYGENLSMSGPGDDMSVKDAVKLWVDEKEFFDYNEPIPDCCIFGEQCLHYTQVVWRDTKSIGCARVTCNNGGTFVNCNYYPHGNVAGEKPY